ncbi:afadin-like isoform X3 [Anguilla rostrata]|uniref:afadin-like isoform X3 n=1 Tax=Anguilla rostrata TaxID=7938 RepID=UPI0030D0C9BB
MSGNREAERRKLADIINHWNANRLDLFEISQPTEDLEFHGVMRFYFQDRVAGNFATKCVRVSSTATTQDVIETLAEKFRPDMRMLSLPKYSLYEVNVSGEERKLDLGEKPLVVQLNWNRDDREGRFVLKNENDFVPKKMSNGPEKHEKEGVIQNFKRTLSKKEKKKERRRENEGPVRVPDRDNLLFNRDDGCKNSAAALHRWKSGETGWETDIQLRESSRLAAEVYKDMPETSFTRTISNPEVVMKRRRQQKLERRMEQFRSSDGRPDSGGTLRIYADSLKPNIPYKTILLSTTDTTDFAVTEALEKYGLERENPREYCIARAVLPPGSQHSDQREWKETILEDTECPLQIFRDWPGDKGALVFQLKKRPLDCMPKRDQGPEDLFSQGWVMDGPPHPDKMAYLVELNPGRRNHYAYYHNFRLHEDGSDSRDKPKLFRLQHSITPVGSEKVGDHSIQLVEPGILPHHCDLTLEDGLVTVTPRCLEAETLVDGHRISETTVLRSGASLQFANSHVFKFVDPSYDRSLDRMAGDFVPGMRSGHKSGSIAEATFDPHRDVCGKIALPTSKSSGKLEMGSGKASERGVVKPLVRLDMHNGRSQDSLGSELTLPARIEFRDSTEDAFLSAVISYTNSSTVHFKLSPTYVLYLTCRFVLSARYRPDMRPAERTHRVIAVVNKMVRMMEGVIQKQKNMAGALAFWMANASELLNFIKQDRDLSRITLDAQDVLAHLVQVAFKYLVYCLQADLGNHMPAFLEDPDEHDSQLAKIEDVLHTLTGAMALLRRCRVNAALTIQLFSQLFHFINMWLFNKLVTEGDLGLCSHYWGAILRLQLSRVEAWAEKQGLELAADCHLSRIVQATTLLTMDKYSMQDVHNIHNTCFKLNSLQLQALLSNYHCAPDEPCVPPELIDSVVAAAESTADELARSDGREVQLEEDPDLQLPFLLPEDGYSCDVVRALPSGFQEFLDPLCQRGFCRLMPLPHSPGTWTVHFSGVDCDGHLSAGTADLPLRKEPEIVTVTLKKNKGMGLSIVAAKGAGQEKLGIYIKSVVKGGVADLDGRLAAGDQLLSVDGKTLVGLSQERAAELMTRTGSVVTLEVAKRGAIYHGLATLLSQSSPMTQRGSENGRGTGKSRPKSEGFELYSASAQNGNAGSPPVQRGHYPVPRKANGEERLLKKRADHLSSPNVANQPESSTAAYSGGPGAKITSVSTGNLFADEEPLSPHPEAYPIPTQTYTRDYFCFTTPLSLDVGAPGSGLPWKNMENRPASPGGVNCPKTTALQRMVLSQEELHEEKVAFPPEGLRPEDPAPKRSWGNEELRNHHHHAAPSSLESSTSSQEQLSYSSSSSSSSSKTRQANHKSGPGRWKTPHPQPARAELPPPPPPPPLGSSASNPDRPVQDLPLPPPAPPSVGQHPASTADCKRREEQRRWYEREKARLEEERERKKREQERKMGQIHGPSGLITPDDHPHGPPPPPQPHYQHRSPRPPHPPLALPWAPPPPPLETVIHDFLPQQQPHTVERRDLCYVTLGTEDPSSDSLSPDPWKRDAREQLEKRQRLRVVDLLDGEIRELRDKVGRTAEENERLRRLQLEWQFQQRLQESKRSEDDEDEEGDEDDEDVYEVTMIAQQLETENRAQQSAAPAISVLDLLQDEEQHRKQQQQGTAEGQDRQEEGEEPSLQRPPLPLDYEGPPTSTNAVPPSPPQRNTSYLKTQAASFDALGPAQLVPYDDSKHEEESTPLEGCDLSDRGNPEVYEDPRKKWERCGQGEELSVSGEASETMTFKDRQQLFSRDKDASSNIVS